MDLYILNIILNICSFLFLYLLIKITCALLAVNPTQSAKEKTKKKKKDEKN